MFPNQMCSSSSPDSNDRPIYPSHTTFSTPQLRKRLMQLTSTEKLNLTKESNNDSGSSSSSCKSQLQLETGIQRQIIRTAYKRLENKCGQKRSERNLEIKKVEKELRRNKKIECELMSKLEEKNNLIKGRSKKTEKLIDTLNKKFSALQADKEDSEVILAEKQRVIVTINNMYLDLEKELQSLREKNKKYSEEIIRLKESNLEIVNRIVTECEQKMEYLEDSLSNKIKNLELVFSGAHKKIQVDFQTTVELFSHKIDLKMQDMHKKIMECFSNIKDLIKIFVNEKENELLRDIYKIDEICNYLYRELCIVEGQKDEFVKSDLEKKLAIVELTEKANTLEEELEHCRTKCKIYEINLQNKEESLPLEQKRHTLETTKDRCNTNIAIELTETDKRKAELQEKLALKEEELENLRKSFITLQKDNKRLSDKLEVSEFKFQYEKTEKENAEQELAQLMGHQNTRQKVRHVNQLKQQNIELKQENLNLKIEVKILKKTLAEVKENAPQQNDSPACLKKKNDNTETSPSILKDRNLR